ncbi:MAG: DUF4091 domain-containing protein [Ruminococcus sp.]|nr:DUF4091 domain-containing protein [Candidatus Copronaster equi]
MIKLYVLSSLNKVFLDEEPKNEKFKGLSLLKKETGSFQIALKNDCEQKLDICIQSDLSVKSYNVENVPVGKVCSNGDDYYLRKESGLFPDLLVESNSILTDGNYRSAWFEIKTDDAKSGNHNIIISFCKDNEIIAECEINVEIINAELPEQNLIYTNWFHTDCLHTWYNVPVFSEDYWRITENFLKTAAEHGMNMVLTPLFTPALDTAVGKERPTVQLVDVYKDGENYTFNFDKLHRWIEMCDRCKIKYFEMSHLFSQWGAMHTPKIMATVNGKYTQIFGWKTWAASKKYESFLRQFAKELCAFLKNEGVEKRCFFHVSDEPSMERLKDYAKRSKLIYELFDGFTIIDALSDIDFYQKGIIKNPIPCINHTIDFVGKVPELWTYYCCGPDSGNYPNRFIGMPMERVRILGYIMYKYNIKGFLQWGLNFWYSQLSDHPVDPFKVTDSDGAFPAGDAFVLYPGENENPLVSMRFKAFKEALQDMRALELLEKLCGRDKALEILQNECEINFNEYPHGSQWLLSKREEINQTIKKAL